VSPPAPILVWLRNDLRLDDHEPLVRAAATGAPTLLVWCVDPRQFGTLPSGVPKTGAFRARFLLEALAGLRTAVRAIGGELAVRHGRPESVLPALARELGASAVHVHDEAAPDETTVEAEVEAALRPLGVPLRGWWGHTLLHVDDLPFDLDEVPRVFTAFRTRVEGGVAPRDPLPAPPRLVAPPVDAGALPTLAELGLTEPPADPRALFVPRGGEAVAQARLREWMWTGDRLARYKETRNGMLAVDDSSKLSPWLAAGCLSPRRVYAEVRRHEQAHGRTDGSGWLIFELLWRDWFRLLTAAAGGRLFSAGGLEGFPVRWRTRDDPAARMEFDAWCAGRTGVPLVDAAMRELAATGFPSNRARQNAASLLTKHLGIDWRLGAEWFESLLVDYDVASNWGNWAYGAGVGHDPRGFRVFDPHGQAERYDPDGRFVAHWLPELARVPMPHRHRPDRAATTVLERAGVRLGVDYPRPVADLESRLAASRSAWERAVASARDLRRSTRRSGR
jgi:deoxyribodipyrimidine photo-lyase